MTLEIQPFGSVHKPSRKKFSCGKISLDDYLNKQMSQDIRNRASTAYVLVNTPNLDILGYYTISASAIDLVDIDKDSVKKLPSYPSLPAMLIGRLAIDENHKGKGYGSLLLVDSLKTILDLSKKVGICAVVVDALDQDALRFYQKFGFKSCQSNSMKLYLLISSVETLLSEVGL